jgi:hypothetical protein
MDATNSNANGLRTPATAFAVNCLGHGAGEDLEIHG